MDSKVFHAYLVNDFKTADDATTDVSDAALTAAAAAAAVLPADSFAGTLALKPKQFFETKEVSRKITVRPLLTPDEGGGR